MTKKGGDELSNENGMQMEMLATEAVEVLRDVLRNVSPTDLDLQRARLAQASLASYARLAQTHGARESARYNMAAMVAPDQLAEYIRLAMPDHKVLTVMGHKQIDSPHSAAKRSAAKRS